MNKLFLLLMVAAIGLVIMGCPGEPKVEPEQPPPQDTTTVAEEPPQEEEPPPPPPKPPLKASQFRTLYFEFDKYALTPEAKNAAEHNAQLLKEYPDAIVQIEGHCDERGTIEYNLLLGEKRAKETKTYLVNLGVQPDRLMTISYGKERPAVEGSGEEVWSKNRRCEFKIISQ